MSSIEFRDEYLALEQDFLEVANSAGAAKYAGPLSLLKARLDEIWDTECIIDAQDMHILMHKAHIMLPVYLKQAQNWQQRPNFTNAVSIFLIESPIPHILKNSKSGPWVFKLVVAPGFNLIAGESITVVVRSVTSKYDVNENAMSAKRVVLPKITIHSPLTRCPDNPDEFCIENLSFDAASNGRPFRIEFNFTVHLQDNPKPLRCIVCSLPFTALSNVTQWTKGEMHYVAYHAFGETIGPLREVLYPAFFNALQFEYLTSTRQLVSEGYLRRLKAKHDHAKESLKTCQKDSETSAGHHSTIALYQGYIDGHRFMRPLTVAEVIAIFPPTGDQSQPTEWVMERSTFSQIWEDWYGEFAYRLYTGQNAGDEPRRLFLDGLIHFAPKGSQDVAILDPAIYPPGTALIRPSSKKGRFTFNTIVTLNGAPTISFKRIEAQRSGFSTDLLNEPYIQWLVNIQGECISSNAFTLIYPTQESAAANESDRYQRTIGDIVDPQQEYAQEEYAAGQEEYSSALLVQALHDYAGQYAGELSFVAGDWITVHERDDFGWWKGEINGLIGYFPSSFVQH